MRYLKNIAEILLCHAALLLSLTTLVISQNLVKIIKTCLVVYCLTQFRNENESTKKPFSLVVISDKMRI